MKVNNPLTSEFLSNYPTEAARVLESVSTEHVAALFDELPIKVGGQVIASMSPVIAAAVLDKMDDSSAANMLIDLPLSTAAYIYRHLKVETRNALSSIIPKKILKSLREQLDFPQSSVGKLLDKNIDQLPEGLTVADAIRRIERFDHQPGNEIYITNNNNQLVGVVEIGKLLISRHNQILQEIMSRKTQSVSAYAAAESVSSHPGWNTRRQLPIVERNDVLIGVLNYSSLAKSLGESSAFVKHDPMENFLSLTSLYWLSFAQLLDSILNITQPRKEERK